MCCDHFISGKPAYYMTVTDTDWAPPLKLGYILFLQPELFQVLTAITADFKEISRDGRYMISVLKTIGILIYLMNFVTNYLNL